MKVTNREKSITKKILRREFCRYDAELKTYVCNICGKYLDSQDILAHFHNKHRTLYENEKERVVTQEVKVYVHS